MHSADSAMYEAKRRGKNQVQLYTPQMGEAARERLELERHLQQALDRGEFKLHYQPQFSLSTGKIVRYEALLRWNHPLLGLVPPAKFIPIAEETSLVIPIGTWVLEEACRQACDWRVAHGITAGVGVNVSMLQFVRPDFVETVISVLDRTGLSPWLLELELTESVVMQGLDEVTQKIASLRSLGISISIDDFGTGYSSLSYLQKLQVDSLKIDRSFVREIAVDSNAASLTKALVSLAHTLGIRVVIEGIENEAQLEKVRGMGCDMAQGFLLGRPAPAVHAVSDTISETHKVSCEMIPAMESDLTIAAV